MFFFIYNIQRRLNVASSYLLDHPDISKYTIKKIKCWNGFVFFLTQKYYYSDNQKTLNRMTTLYQYFSLFDVVPKQIVLINTFLITKLGKWVTLSHVH